MGQVRRVAVTLEQCWHDVPGGTATSALGSVRALARRDDLEVVGVSARHRDLPRPPFRPAVPVRALPLPRLALYESWHWLRRPPVERATGPVDVVHATGMAVPPAHAPLVVTVHDLAFLHDPAQFTRRGLGFFHRAIELARRDADIVVCPSMATLEDCVDHGFERDRLRHVPWGVDPVEVPDTARDAVRRRYGLDRRFVLWVGTIEPRKNLPLLLDAFGRVDPEVDLVLAGPQGWGTGPGGGRSAALASAIERLGTRVRLPGFVPAGDLDALMAEASVFCFPSFREGFGMPVLDAMAHGVPVVSSAGTAMAELLAPEGDAPAGILVEPTDAAGLSHALGELLEDGALAARLGAAGRVRAATYGWDRTASGLVAAYDEAITRRQRPSRRSLVARRDPQARRGIVGWNLLWVDPGVVGGSEEYTIGLLGAVLERSREDLAFVAFVNRNLLDAYPVLWDKVETVVAPTRGANRATRIALESTWLLGELRRHGVQLTHHLGGTIPLVRPGPVVVTIHDLQPLVMPEHFSVLKRRYLAWALPFATRSASAVVTLSGATRDHLVQRLGVDADAVRLVPPGLDHLGPAPSRAERAAVRHRYGIDDRPFVLFPAITYPHKNHRLLLRAFAELVVDRPDARLVLSGGSGPEEPVVSELIGSLGLAGHVRRIGRIPRGDLETLYWEAATLAFPSRFEGFGMPVVEAMARSCPVLVSDVGALVEITGGAGVVLPADDARAWRDAMASVLGDPAWRTELAQRSATRARDYTWERSVEVLVDLYRSVLDDQVRVA